MGVDYIKLANDLYSSDPSVTEKAVELLQEIRGESIETVMGLLSSPDPEMRISAMRILARIIRDCLTFAPTTGRKQSLVNKCALGEVGGEAAIRAIALHWNDSDQNVRTQAIYILDQARHVLSVDFLLALLADESPGVRSYAAWGLDGKESQRILEPLVAGLCDSDAYVRAYALNSLESIFRNSEDYPFSMKAVIPLLSDSSALVRAAAVEIMQHCKDQNVFDYIVTALNDKNPRVRASSATTLMMIGRENEDTASHLMGAAEDTDEKVRKSVAHALACTQFWLRDRNPTVIKTIGDLLRDPVDSVRIAAAKGLSDINDDMAAKVLVSALNDVNPKVRRYALLGLDAAGNPESFNRLLDTLQHGTDEERKGAAEALGASDNPRAFQPLVDVLRNKDNNYLVRMSAASALGNLGDPNAVIPLIENLKDESGDVRDAVSSALEWIADERCTDALIEALEDEYKYVRASACQGLEKIGDRKAIEPIRRLLNDEDEYVRSVAKKALKSFKVDV